MLGIVQKSWCLISMRKLFLLLALPCLSTAVSALTIQNGFIPDLGGKNLDAVEIKTEPTPAPVNVSPLSLDCAECPPLVKVSGGSARLESLSEQGRIFREVSLKPFAIGKSEVTQDEWYELMSYNPSIDKGKTKPVEDLSLSDVEKYINKLNKKTGQKYRLPSETELHYAQVTAQGTTWSKIWSWTLDCWHEDYSGAPADGSPWTTNCTDNYRTLRNGSAARISARGRTSVKFGDNRDDSRIIVGFRLARDL